MKEIEVFEAAVKKDMKKNWLSWERAKLLFQSIMQRLRQKKEQEENL